MEIKKPYAVVQYNKLMKGVDRADQYLSYYLVLRKTAKWLIAVSIIYIDKYQSHLCTNIIKIY
jgi:hypothetical protein